MQFLMAFMLSKKIKKVPKFIPVELEDGIKVSVPITIQEYDRTQESLDALQLEVKKSFDKLFNDEKAKYKLS